MPVHSTEFSDGETTLDEMERLVRELRVIGEEVTTNCRYLAEAEEEKQRLADIISGMGSRRVAVQARLLVLATWINT